MGRLLHEFAVTIAASILVSGFVSLSLTPMLCSRFLRPPASAHHGRFYQSTERAFDWLLDGYRRSLAVVMTYRRAMLALALGLLAATFYLLAVIPKGFLPSEDQGQVLMFTKAAQGISYDAMVKHQEAIADIIRRDPNVTTYFSSAGATGFSGGGNTGILFAHLKPLGERKLSVDQVMDELRPKLAAVPGHYRVPAESAADPDRRQVHRSDLPAHAAKPQQRRTLQVRADSGAQDAIDARADRRHQRPADLQSAGQRRYRSRQGTHARYLGRIDRRRAR